MTKVFLVKGHAGGVYYLHEWIVAAYESEIAAQQFVSNLLTAAAEYGSDQLQKHEREVVVAHFENLGFHGCLPSYGYLEDLSFYVVETPFVAGKEANGDHVGAKAF